MILNLSFFSSSSPLSFLSQICCGSPSSISSLPSSALVLHLARYHHLYCTPCGVVKDNKRYSNSHRLFCPVVFSLSETLLWLVSVCCWEWPSVSWSCETVSFKVESWPFLRQSRGVTTEDVVWPFVPMWEGAWMNLVSVHGREKDLSFVPLSPSRFSFSLWASHVLLCQCPLPPPSSLLLRLPFLSRLSSFISLLSLSFFQNVFRYVAPLLLSLLLILLCVLNFFSVLSLILFDFFSSNGFSSLLFSSLSFLLALGFLSFFFFF